MIAVCMARNEAAIIGTVIDHLYAEGVDRVVVEDGTSTDDTYEIALEHGATVLREPSRVYDQPATMNRLISEWASPGEWVIPFDADEFWCGLTNLNGEAVAVPVYLHRDPKYRRPHPKPLPKVAYRYQPDVILGSGNHTVNLPTIAAEITVREWQYRSLDHLRQKAQKTRELHEHTPDLPAGYGAHADRLAAMTDLELAAEWDTLLAGDWTHDPIPCRFL